MTSAIHNLAPEQALEDQQVEVAKGLDKQQVEERRHQHGRNQLQEHHRRPAWRILLEQFQSIVILLLAAAALAAVATQRWPEAIAVAAVIAVNTAIGFFTEWRAVQSMEALRERSQHDCRLRRQGEEKEVKASQVVPGDILLLRSSDVVAADARLLEAEGLRLDESALTGESVTVVKNPEAVAEETGLAERTSMVYKGTSVADGSGEAVVVATGGDTELGKIADLAEQAEAAQTPLQQRLNQLGGTLAWVTIAIAALVAAAGWWAGQPPLLMVETAIALGVAAIPEGLPIVATMALARGMYLMAEKNAVVNRLPAVETLGATGLIMTDKTGTLTENQMEVHTLAMAEDEVELSETDQTPTELLRLGVLCNNANLGEEPSGDPEEIALLRAAGEAGIDAEELHRSHPRESETSFSHQTMKMATQHSLPDGGILIAVKGAPEAVLSVCDRTAGSDGDEPLDERGRTRWQERADQLAERGLRLLAVADRRVEEVQDDPYAELRLVGLVGLLDPPREGTKTTIDTCQAAGIRVKMVTGDLPTTAEAVAEAVGIVGDPEDPEAAVLSGDQLEELSAQEAHTDEVLASNIFARVEPKQKLDLIELHQQQGDVVAMTGDGINDAPALKKADIGVAMGRRGTEAAKQVADMVLSDDRLETLVSAVEQGRVIFDNIRKSVMFMLCTNLAEVLAVTIASLLGWVLPLRPLQILYLNVLTDVFPALALGVGPAAPKVMERRPRDQEEKVLTRSHWLRVGAASVVVAATVLGALQFALQRLGLDDLAAVTVAFLTLAFAKLWFTFNLRDRSSGWLDNEVTRNPWVWGALLLCTGLLLAAVYVPFLASVLEVQALSPAAWGTVLGFSLIPLAAGQLWLMFEANRQAN